MKKHFLKTLLLASMTMVTLVILAACASVKTAYFQSIDQGSKRDSQITIEYKGDEMVKSETVNVVYYKESGVSEEAIKQQLEAYDKQMGDLKGFTHKVDFKEDHVVETTTIDYAKADIQELEKKQLIQTSANQKASYISYKATIETFTSRGYKEVKDGKFEELQ